MAKKKSKKKPSKRKQLSFGTDVAMMCVYDPELLDHRTHDEADWIADDDALLMEMSAGNAIFVQLGSDGIYRLRVVDSQPDEPAQASARLRCSSGHLLVDGAENVPAAGFTADRKRGILLSCEPGYYVVKVAATDFGKLDLFLHATHATNSATTEVPFVEYDEPEDKPSAHNAETRIDFDRRELPNSDIKRLLRSSKCTPKKSGKKGWLVYKLKEANVRIYYRFEESAYTLEDADGTMAKVANLAEVVSRLDANR